jgi:DnaJ-class molecular chaperone
MDNIHKSYYDLLEIKITSTSDEIIKAYKNKINKFKNIINFNHDQISEIKLLKKALYILLDKKLKLKYDSNIKLINDSIINYESNNNELNNNEPLPVNFEINTKFDTIFNIDNSWMKSHNVLINNEKKNNIENNIFSDRIFSLSTLNKKPGYSTNDEINLRNPLQGRVIKS